MRPSWADPTADLFRLREQLYRLLDDSFASQQGVEAPRSFSPNVDILTADDQVLILVGVPGMAREDLSVQVEASVVTISGERKPATLEGRLYRRERPAGAFSRSFSLGYDLDPDSVEAKLEDGLLRVSVQRKPSGGRIEVR